MSHFRNIFRARHLSEEDDVYSQNTWDDVQWTEEMERNTRETIEKHRECEKDGQEVDRIVGNSNTSWDRFYTKHGAKFFKPRNWLDVEVPELFGLDRPVTVFEVGCGTGSTLFPLAQTFDAYGKENTQIHLHGCDVSGKAVSIVREAEEFDPRRMNVFCHDIADGSAEELAEQIRPGSVDFVFLVFVLSAIRPSKVEATLRKIHGVMKEGGTLFFRDYAVGDLAQLRFKEKNCLAENFYARGDGTCAGFFAEESIRETLEGCGFHIGSGVVDTRLLVNRKRKIVMHRKWHQIKCTKQKETGADKQNGN
ncbi:MAG: methyltransferase-like protein [Amphiamblys sp. WSBS2006]|nr:MAG: methyltransferase-like protein [Amphiamblys sp. WSBS2006]